jgi:hypothetical protein
VKLYQGADDSNALACKGKAINRRLLAFMLCRAMACWASGTGFSVGSPAWRVFYVGCVCMHVCMLALMLRISTIESEHIPQMNNNECLQ